VSIAGKDGRDRLTILLLEEAVKLVRGLDISCDGLLGRDALASGPRTYAQVLATC
jgi:hypothetical protein